MSDLPTRLDLSEQLQRLAPKSRRIYGRWIQRFLGEVYQVEANQFNLAAIRPEIITTALTPEHLTKWLDELNRRHLSGATIVQARSAIIWLAGCMSTTRRIPPQAAGALMLVKSPSQPQRQEQTWLTAEQSRALMRALDTSDVQPSVKARNMAMICLMLTGGLRREEVIEARWGDLLHGARLTVHGKGRKDRIIDLAGIAAQALEAWKKFHPCPYGTYHIFTQIRQNGIVTTLPLSGQSVIDIVKVLGGQIGVDVSPHDLRRTYAQAALDGGVPIEEIAEQLGHESLGTTQVYLRR